MPCTKSEHTRQPWRVPPFANKSLKSCCENASTLKNTKMAVAEPVHEILEILGLKCIDREQGIRVVGTGSDMKVRSRNPTATCDDCRFVDRECLKSAILLLACNRKCGLWSTFAAALAARKKPYNSSNNRQRACIVRQKRPGPRREIEVRGEERRGGQTVARRQRIPCKFPDYIFQVGMEAQGIHRGRGGCCWRRRSGRSACGLGVCWLHFLRYYCYC